MSRSWPAGLLAAASLVAAGAAPGTPGSTVQLPQLMALLGRRDGAQAQFEETQYLAILTRPLQSAGTLLYRAPDYLEERIAKPRRQDLIDDHGMLTVQLGRHRRTLPLADYPQLAPLLDSIRATLAGDAPALQGRFVVQLSGSLAHWRLALTPRSSTLLDTISAIELQGTGVQIEQVSIRQTNGDHAVMRIQGLP